MTHIKQISAIILISSIGLSSRSQSTVIDPLTGSLSEYTTTLVNDVSDGAGRGVSFTDSASGLQANYVGTGTTAEQALFLAPASSFSQTFAVGDTLWVNTAMSASSTTEDFGLAIAATATPTPAGSGNSFNSRTSFDWASVSLRPSQSTVRFNTDISGTLNTATNAAVGTVANVSELFVTWNSADSFSLGYVSNSIPVTEETVTFASGSAIGDAIGFYGDLRSTGGVLGDITDLTITPEPSTFALCSMGFVGLAVWTRRKK